MLNVGASAGVEQVDCMSEIVPFAQRAELACLCISYQTFLSQVWSPCLFFSNPLNYFSIVPWLFNNSVQMTVVTKRGCDFDTKVCMWVGCTIVEPAALEHFETVIR